MTLLFKYAHAVYVTAGLGFMNKKEFMNRWSVSSGKSVKSLYRCLEKLKNLGVLRENNGVVYLLGKDRALRALGYGQNFKHVKFSDQHLKDYTSFKKHCISQVGVYYQKAFRYAHKFIIKNTKCPLQSQRIQFPISENKGKVGVGAEYLAKKLGISRGTVRNGLCGVTKRNLEFLKTVSSSELNIIKKTCWSPRYRVKKSKDGLQLFYILPSTITCDSYLGGNHKRYNQGIVYGKK